mgnify:CR=1 FL=1
MNGLQFRKAAGPCEYSPLQNCFRCLLPVKDRLIFRFFLRHKRQCGIPPGESAQGNNFRICFTNGALGFIELAHRFV